jgi:hypothetical protein
MFWYVLPKPISDTFCMPYQTLFDLATAAIGRRASQIVLEGHNQQQPGLGSPYNKKKKF